MSFDAIKTIDFLNAPFQQLPQDIVDEAFEDLPILGAILSDLKHVWQAKGSCLEVRNMSTGRKVGSWVFGGILKDSNTKIVAVDEFKRTQGQLSFLIVALECTISGGLLCVFDIFGSKVLRVIQVKEQITSLHVIDSTNMLVPEPSPLRYFDGLVAIGTLGGNVFVLDLCQQVCENATLNSDSITVRDELDPCQMVILRKEKINSIKKYVEHAVEKDDHLAIHLNVVLNPSTEHFTLKGEKGEDRVHVNRSEAQVSSLYYSPQLASLLIGYNFGCFQLWDLRSLILLYTSPICENNIPVTHFTVQEPADDPKAYCYIWVSYSHDIIFHNGFPFAVMYSFYYDTKKYINDYGTLYDDFQHSSVRFQIELGEAGDSTYKSRITGGSCIGLQSLSKNPVNKDLNALSLCVISWFVWNTNKELSTSVLVFDLNQWYKEQMPSMPVWSDCSNYIIKHNIPDQFYDVKLDKKSLDQFIGVQRLEEHFCPTSLSFDLWCLVKEQILKMHNKGLQKHFIDKLRDDQHLSLVKPDDYFDVIIELGLVPLFCEINPSSSQDITYQREMLLNVALEQKLIGWLCQCCSKIANNAFNSCGLTFFGMIAWAFQRALTLKNHCDKYCIPLFDYSGSRLDNNTMALLSSSISQIKDICTIYRHISNNLQQFVADQEALAEEQHSLENVVIYYEVLLWMANIGLLPEHNKKMQHNLDNYWNAPYLIDDLTEYYNKKRAQLQLVAHETFVQKDCLLYIDNLINRKAAEQLRIQWQEDGGNGLYPAPSLQSVLRTYLLHSTDLLFKHSLVTYTLLDVATSVDENNKVIKLLLKFPQIFDLSQSVIKIIQAFWHLDHDDYETALEYILDPCVLAEDLHHWHHSVMMRSLLLQEQYNFALVYLQIRKPSIQDEKDLFTVVSLLVSKNMLDEAFKFKQHYQSINEHTLLTHIFNECNKTESLHSILYRCLNNEEERAFFRYLQSTRSPRCEDLKIFYFLLRSRFLEAFDSYSSNKRSKPENQGLMGQKDATTADNIVRMFKSLLPDVNKNLVELVRKERSNLWKEVEKPTPLSVFVHNAKDQVQYKSSVIFAALAKAKQTFDTTLNESKCNNEVVTEETPFLRTPTIFKSMSRIEKPLVKSKIIEQNELGEEYGPSPCKKLKLSPRASKLSPVKNLNTSSIIHSKLATPIVRRKNFSIEPDASCSTILPHSILKVSSRTILDDSILNGNTSTNVSAQLQCENSFRKAKLTLTSRKSISNTPQKSQVKFDDLCYSSSSAEVSSNNENTLISPPEAPSKRLSKNSTGSTNDDVFLSPENSFEISSDKNTRSSRELIRETIKGKTLSPEKLNFDETLVSQLPSPRKNDKVEMYVSMAENDLSTNRLTFQSPKSRRSYKRSLSGSPISSPLRSSPRLLKKQLTEVCVEPTMTEENTSMQSLPSSPKISHKLKGRRSLSRAVLENNAFSTLQASIHDSLKEKRFSPVKPLSQNTSLNDSETDYDPNDSIDNFLKKYGPDDITNKDNSFNESLFEPEKGKLVSKITETTTTELRRENVKLRGTNESVSSKEIKNESHSKTVEFFGDNSYEKNTKTDTNKTVYEQNVANADDDAEVISEHESINSTEYDKKHLTSQNETEEEDTEAKEINIYEDLSSGSEDVRQVLLKNVDSENVYSSLSYTRNETFNNMEQQENIEIDEVVSRKFDESNSNFVDDSNVAEKAFVTDDVIEIGSSSDEDEEENDNQSNDVEDVYNSSTGQDSNESNAGSSVKSIYEVYSGEERDMEQCTSTVFEKPQIIYAEKTGEKLEETNQTVSELQESFRTSNEHMDHLILTEEEMEIHDKVEEREPFSSENKIDLNEHSQPDETAAEQNSVIIKQKSTSDFSIQTTMINTDVIKGAEDDESKHVETGDKIAVKQNADIIKQKSTSDFAVQTTIINLDMTKSIEDDESGNIEKHTKSLQCTLGMKDSQLDVSVETKTMSSDDSPLVLKSVKKTYISKSKVISGVPRLSSTPKLTMSTNKRTYSKKEHHVPTISVQEYNDSGGLDNQDKETAGVSGTLAGKKEQLETVEDTEKGKPDETVNSKEDSKVQDSLHTSIDTKGQLETKDEEVKDKSEKVVDASKEDTITGPITRHRSMMLQQQEGTPDRISFDSEQKSQGSKHSDSRGSSRSSISHTPGSRRVTRRMSQLSDSVFDSTYVGDSPAKPVEVDIMDTTISVDKTVLKVDHEILEMYDGDTTAITPGKASLRKYLKAKDVNPLDSSIDLKKIPKKRTRSASVDQPANTSRKRGIRSKSIDLEDFSKTDKEAFSGNVLTAIEEIPGTSTERKHIDDVKYKNKATSDVGGYTTTRRLTRRQASMLKSIGTIKEDAESLPNLEEIDPIQLLDKPVFEGQPDLAETQAYAPSSPSGSVDLSRHIRSASVISDTAEPSTPRRRSKAVSESVDSPASTIKSRLRRPSVDTASLVSEQSDSPSPPKRTRKKETTKEDDPEASTEETTRRRRKSRSSSVSSIKSHISDKTESSVVTRSRRIHSVKSELPEIEEENSPMEESARKGRRKKH
ncbi:uncharacterized protein LOC143202735 isoform X1 [Rhynchophorus ferrugineus]|uniref:uncharacterized protein LOC143202735 isoform X1 n=1 Tax=Rhynchophorus ferrugineus TaxID=354439 RepID=UPI003FCCF090